ncbi:hypothetical protein QFC20_003735 [Naganishia adeliensis]|uniref:Uncharacterized protein n=1 Tax=Naganishia adeliensis TaxID=92952 RepID=A0ACC2W9M7_9TREE|nr:hypothetical protein QFC20_003735 [Naganishia adeliensis]
MSKGNDSSASVQGTASEFDGGDERGGQRESVGPTKPTKTHATRAKSIKDAEQEGGEEVEGGEDTSAAKKRFDFIGIPPEPIIGIPVQDLWITRTIRQTLAPNSFTDRFVWTRRHSADQYLATCPWIPTDKREVALFRDLGCIRCRGKWPCGEEGPPCPRCIADRVPPSLCVGFLPAELEHADDISEADEGDDLEDLISDEEDDYLGEEVGEGMGEETGEEDED